MSETLELKSKPLHEVITVTAGLINMQTNRNNGILNDVSIPYWRGAPGIGKTAFCQLFISKFGMNVLETHFGQTPIEEVSGLPDFVNIKVNGNELRGTVWTLPEVLTQLYQVAENGKPTVWLLDDFHLAPASMMALGFEMFTKHKLRGQKLPENVGFLLAGNMSAKAGSKKNLLSAVVNRCVVMPVHSDFDHWKKNFALPNDINSKVVSFLSNAKYSSHFQQEEQLEQPWASARSWTKFANLLSMLEQYYPQDKLTHRDILYYCSGHVGTLAASDFTAYYKIYSQVETEKIFDGLIPVIVPTHFAGQYVFVIANTNEFINRFKKANQNDRGKLVETMAKIITEVAMVKPQIAVSGMKDLILLETSLNLRNVYGRVKSVIALTNPEVNQKLEEDIKSL